MKGGLRGFYNGSNSVVPRCHDSTELDFSPLLFYFFSFYKRLTTKETRLR